MPLKEGKSAATHGANVAEMLRGYAQRGKIGNTKPKSKKKAIEIANAAAYRKQRESGGGGAKSAAGKGFKFQ